MDGTRTRIAEGMATPVGIAPAGSGTAYVTNCTADRILRISADGISRTIAEGAPLNCPNGRASGGDGALYTANFRDGSVIRIALPSDEMTPLADLPGGGNGHPNVAVPEPRGLMVCVIKRWPFRFELVISAVDDEQRGVDRRPGLDEIHIRGLPVPGIGAAIMGSPIRPA